MIDPTLSITVDRSGMPGDLPPLVFSGAGGSALTIVTFSPPASMARNTYAQPSPFVHGQELTGSAEEQGLLSWSYFAGQVTTETGQQASKAAVKAALKQISFQITTEVSGAPAEVWWCDPGDHQLASSNGRTYADLANVRPQYAVLVPVYPIPSAA